MIDRLKMPIVLLMFILVCPILQAQSIYGSWTNSQFNAAMTLNQDGTFLFNGPYGQSTGMWSVQGNYFYMQDAAGQILQYSIQHFSEGAFHLVDAYGVALNYERPVQSVQLNQGSLLAEAGGYQLTDAHVQVGVGIIQFIIGQEITPNEVKELTQVSIEEFSTQPQEFLSQITGLNQSLTTLRSLQDPVQIGTMRQMLIAEFHKATLPMAEHEKPLLIQIINRYVHVMAFDAANNLVLTDQDADAMIAYMEFSNQLSGLNQTFSQLERQNFHQELISQFSGMSLEQKQFLCSASLAWNLVQGNWQRMNQMQRGQIQQNYAGTIAGQNQSYQNTATPGNVTQADLNKMARENAAQQNMFNMMNNMSLQNHATMLNTIENFGGTGNYWEVTDMGY